MNKANEVLVCYLHGVRFVAVADTQRLLLHLGNYSEELLQSLLESGMIYRKHYGAGTYGDSELFLTPRLQVWKMQFRDLKAGGEKAS